MYNKRAMARPALSSSTIAAAVGALLAFAAIGLAVTSIGSTPPRFADMAVIDGTLRERPGGLIQTKLRIGSQTGEHVVDAAACGSRVKALNPGDGVAVWIDERSRAWRVMRGGKPICTYLQAMKVVDESRRSRRIAAIVLALAGVACIGATIVGRALS
jgi:hypothetical protein